MFNIELAGLWKLVASVIWRWNPEEEQVDSLADSHLCEFEFSKTGLVVGGRREGGDRECKLTIGLGDCGLHYD